MVDRDDYQAVMQLLSAAPLPFVLHPTMPTKIYLQEAADLHVWSGQDHVRLVARGLDPGLHESLQMRIGALRHAQSLWKATWRVKENAQKQWAEQSPAGYELCDNLGHEFLFAYRDTPDLLSKVREINEGSGSADLVQDLSNFEVLGRKFPAPLEATGFDFSMLDTAAEMATRLSDLLAASRGEKGDKTAKQNRDKTFTYLKLAVDEIRKYGKFVCWQEPERLKGYSSEYGRKGPGPGDSNSDSSTPDVPPT